MRRTVLIAVALLIVFGPACVKHVEYARPSADRPVTLPRDHFAHPEFQTEWWYYTGHLKDESGARYGFQIVFFQRRSEADLFHGLPVRWFGNPVYMAHFAVTDLSAGSHVHEEAASGGRRGRAGAREDTFRVWVGDWLAEEVAGLHHLSASMEGYAIDLLLDPAKPPVINGEGGISQKGVGGPSAYYISFTRLIVEGYLTVGGQPLAVTGTAWMDHEILGGGMTERVRGWDWFSIQLDNDTELMVFLLHNHDGTIDPLSAGTFVRPDGSYETFLYEDFTIEATGEWTSPESGATYPAAWRIQAPRFALDLTVEAAVADQELSGGRAPVIYWEGSIRVRGTAGEAEVGGYGYAELTGYAGPVIGL